MKIKLMASVALAASLAFSAAADVSDKLIEFDHPEPNKELSLIHI